MLLYFYALLLLFVAAAGTVKAHSGCTVLSCCWNTGEER
jgi:hypothetical protein